MHAWQFCNGRLPVGKAAMLSRMEDVHGYSTRAARSALYLSTRDQQWVGYRVPVEWAGLAEAPKGVVFLSAFKGGLRRGFLESYGLFVCVDWWCDVCGGVGLG